ncbi:hypothetical protein [Cellulosimicrobium sp. CUA-896]|uniref:hypothetical protein n=1 Tax=Cellulosimicrobium sp. CUA-896 TaxID=1517881 RepID=UPI0021017D70|nr:hypothetical protein [Cellulosimicrobium sp. CUA-896]
MLLSVVVLLPAVVGLVLVAVPRLPDAVASWTWLATTLVVAGLVAWTWWGFDPGGGVQYDVKVPWIPTVDASYHVASTACPCRCWR